MGNVDSYKARAKRFSTSKVSGPGRRSARPSALGCRWAKPGHVGEPDGGEGSDFPGDGRIGMGRDGGDALGQTDRIAGLADHHSNGA